MAPAGKIAGEHRAADSAPCASARAKQAIIVVGNAYAQDIAVVCKHGWLSGKGDGGIAAVGGHIDKGHSSPNARRHWTKIEIYGPIGKGADRHASCVQPRHSNGEIAFKRLVEK